MVPLPSLAVISPRCTSASSTAFGKPIQGMLTLETVAKQSGFQTSLDPALIIKQREAGKDRTGVLSETRSSATIDSQVHLFPADWFTLVKSWTAL